MLDALRIRNLTIHYPSSPAPLFSGLDVVIPSGWTGVLGSNGIGKSTLMKAVCGLLPAQDGFIAGSVDGPERKIYCPQRTDDPPAQSQDYLAALYDGDGDAGKLMGLLGLGHDWYYRWDSLSFGERKRFQIAVALWLDPEVIALDEPTNHLDDQGRSFLLNAMRSFKGIAMVVSHDRDLLDQLCDRCLFIRSSGVRLRPGGATAGMEEERRESMTARRTYEKARSEIEKLEREASARRRLAEGQQKRRSKRGLDPKDRDGRFRSNLARISGKDGTGGKLLRQMDGRLAQAHARLDETRVAGGRKTGITLTGEQVARDRLVFLPEGPVAQNGEPLLLVPELVLHPGERVALTGANGAGKSTLIRRILHLVDLDRGRILYLPQDLSAAETSRLSDRLANLGGEEKGKLMSTVSRLGSDPKAILTSEALSPGEARKLLVAFGIEDAAELVILDEPTNHMDLDSLTALEEALSDLPCAMIVVSHDRRFREALTDREWRIVDGELVIDPLDEGIVR